MLSHVELLIGPSLWGWRGVEINFFAQSSLGTLPKPQHEIGFSNQNDIRTFKEFGNFLEFDPTRLSSASILQMSRKLPS